MVMQAKQSAADDRRGALMLGELLQGKSVGKVLADYHHGDTARYTMLVFAVSTVALFVVLRWKGPALRVDNTPLGMGVKGMLIMACVALVYMPFELFAKGPRAVRRAFKTS